MKTRNLSGGQSAIEQPPVVMNLDAAISTHQIVKALDLEGLKKLAVEVEADLQVIKQMIAARQSNVHSRN